MSDLSAVRSREISISAPLNKDVVMALRDSMPFADSQPHVFVVFGASGDLAKKKIYPTLWWFFSDGLLPSNIWIVGYARSKLNLKQLRANFEQYCKVKRDECEQYKTFLSRLEYIQGQYDKRDGFIVLQKYIDELCRKSNAPVNRLYYLALPPSVFTAVFSQLKANCMDHGDSWTRIVIEKPFGRDSESSNLLSCHLAKLFKEEQLYRIDHCLGKEMVQNLMVLKFELPLSLR